PRSRPASRVRATARAPRRTTPTPARDGSRAPEPTPPTGGLHTPPAPRWRPPTPSPATRSRPTTQPRAEPGQGGWSVPRCTRGGASGPHPHRKFLAKVEDGPEYGRGVRSPQPRRPCAPVARIPCGRSFDRPETRSFRASHLGSLGRGRRPSANRCETYRLCVEVFFLWGFCWPVAPTNPVATARPATTPRASPATTAMATARRRAVPRPQPRRAPTAK